MKFTSFIKVLALACTATLSMSVAAFANADSEPSQNLSVVSSDQAKIYMGSHADIEVVDPAFYNADVAVIVGEQTDILRSLGAEASPQAARCPLMRAGFIHSHQWMESTNGCGIIGASKNANYRYGWTKDRYYLNVAPDACVQGRGYSYNLSVQEPLWFNAGCGANGEVVATIGNRITVAKIRGRTMGNLPSAVYWR